MPIFEYRCLTCGTQFEFLVLPAFTSTAECPSCQSQDLEKLISLAAISSDQTQKRARRAQANALSVHCAARALHITAHRDHPNSRVARTARSISLQQRELFIRNDLDRFDAHGIVVGRIVDVRRDRDATKPARKGRGE
jgi:putative FmdB family regulatory protein